MQLQVVLTHIKPFSIESLSHAVTHTLRATHDIANLLCIPDRLGLIDQMNELSIELKKLLKTVCGSFASERIGQCNIIVISYFQYFFPFPFFHLLEEG